MWDKWVVDCASSRDGMLMFCPVELDPEGNPDRVVVGMVTNAPRGEVVAAFHIDGPDALNAWIEAHPNWRDELPAVSETVTSEGKSGAV